MSANTERRKKSSFLPVLIIATLAIGLYLNTLKNGFVYDDEFTIVKNTFVQSFNNLPLLFDKTAYFSRSKEMSYRPVVTFTYFIDYALYGLKPWGYHLTNILLHGANGVLLYFFLPLLFNQSVNEKHGIEDRILHTTYLTSHVFLISILFVSHPVLTEAINCISYREDLLVFLFYVATLSLYLRLRQPTSDHRPPAATLLYFLSCLTYLLALLSKEMAVTLPLIILSYEWLYGKEKMKLLSRLFNLHIIGYITITLFYLNLRFYLFHNPKEQIQAWSLIERFLTLPWLIMNYLKLSLFPVHLSADYVINPVNSPFSPIFILPVIALVPIFIIILLYSPFNKGRNKRCPSLATGDEERFDEDVSLGQKSLLFSAIFSLITLMPVYNLVPIFNPFAERYLYLPVTGFILSTMYIAYLIVEKLKVISKYLNRYIRILLLIVLILFSFSVVKRNITWRDSISLWSDTVAKVPSSNKAHYNLGNTYARQGLFDQAIKEYLTAIRLRPDDAEAHNNLGYTYAQQGLLDQAIKEYLTAIRLKPDDAEAYYNLGNTYAQQGLFDQAIREYLTVVRLKPDYAEAYNNLGNTYAQQGLFDQAIKEYLTAIRLRPDSADAHYNLGVAYSEKDRYDEAINEFTIALKWKPDYKEAYYNMEALMKKRRIIKDADPQPGEIKTGAPE